MKTSLSLVVATTALMTISYGVQACEGDSDFIGAVCFTAATYCPVGYLEANGQNVPINQYPALYSLVGNIYGGKPGQSFGLPNMQGFSPVGQGTGPGLTAATQYTTRGAESQTLTMAQMPAHTHASTLNVTLNATATTGANAAPSATNNQLAVASPAAKMYAPSTSGGTSVPLAGVNGGITGAILTLANNGGTTPLPTISPQLVLKACIAANGIYPVKPN